MFMGIPISFNVMSLPSLFCSYSKISKVIQDQNIRRTLSTRQKIYNCQQSCFFICSLLNFNIILFYFLFSSNPQNSSFFYTIHRSSIRHWIKMPIFLVNGSNHFIDMSVLYRINYQLFIFKPFRYYRSGRKSTMLRLDFKQFSFNHVS